LNNRVRFFIDKNCEVDTNYYNIPIPQIGATVWLHDEPLRVHNVSYSYKECENDYNMIDVFVEHMEDEDYADFN